MQMKKLIIVVVAMAILTGCSPKWFSYQGATITHADHLIRLQEGEQQGIWKTNDLGIEYRMQKVSGNLTISGTIDFSSGFLHGFNTINRFVVQLLLVNGEGMVMDNIVVYSSEDNRSINITPLYFEKTAAVPQECRSISFTYDGLLMDGGGGGEATSTSVWYFPQ